MSETERSEKLGARKKKKVTKTKVKEIQKAEEMPLEEKIGMPLRMKYKSSGEDTLYPLKELEALELAGSDSEQELSESEEEELEEEAAIYEEERYGPRWRATLKKPKVMDPLWARLVILFLFFFVWDREATDGKLKPGPKPLWQMVPAFLEDKRCEEAIRAVRTGQRVLAEQQESMSEGEKVSKEKKKRKGDKRNREKVEIKNGVSAAFVVAQVEAIARYVIRLWKPHRVILIRFHRGRPPENLFGRIKQKDKLECAYLDSWSQGDLASDKVLLLKKQFQSALGALHL
ncbi:uncharacterized protein LOC134483001 [Rattus norvegicus]|uniref:uncharacterized protein LOC134483001 n=1 Tax=Rattus norvegicus TaxID=10116 RepID=UPI002FD8714A